MFIFRFFIENKHTMISTDSFYGGVSPAQVRIEALLKKNPIPQVKQLPFFVTSLLGPSRTWKIFKKQADAILCAERIGHGVLSFAFESSVGQRLFLTCHPTMLWFILNNRPSDEKCTYEIIKENSVCKLYLDIEFEYEFNSGYDFFTGERMLGTFLRLLRYFLKAQLDIICGIEDILDLDSSTNLKFSRHIIFNLPNAAFVNNFIVGNIVQTLCQNINAKINSNETDLYGISTDLLKELEIVDRKGKRKLFVDTGVYTRNRHFRLLGCTKLSKNTPLTVSKINKYQPEDNSDLAFFQSSLITFFDAVPSRVIDFGPSLPSTSQNKRSGGSEKIISSFTSSSSLDFYISQMVSPNGRIRQRKYFGNVLKYEIAGYRFCGNINREHRSNNICFVIELDRMIIYQTCYDPDCKFYKSAPSPLPLSITLPNEDDPILLEVIENTLSDEELFLFLNNFESYDLMSKEITPSSECGTTNDESFPDMDVSDEIMLEAADSADAAMVLYDQ